MGILLGQLPPAELARLKAELAETLIANFCYPRFFDYRTSSLRMRPVDRVKRQEVWLYLSSIDFTAWSRVDLMSPDFQRYIERLFIQFVQRNRNFFGQQGRKRMPDVRMLINASATAVTEGLRGHLTGRRLSNPPFGSPRPVLSWATTNITGRVELDWEQIVSMTMLLQQQVQESRGEIKATTTGEVRQAPARRTTRSRTAGNGTASSKQPAVANTPAVKDPTRATVPLPDSRNTATPLPPAASIAIPDSSTSLPKKVDAAVSTNGSPKEKEKAPVKSVDTVIPPSDISAQQPPVISKRQTREAPPQAQATALSSAPVIAAREIPPVQTTVTPLTPTIQPKEVSRSSAQSPTKVTTTPAQEVPQASAPEAQTPASIPVKPQEASPNHTAVTPSPRPEVAREVPQERAQVLPPLPAIQLREALLQVPVAGVTIRQPDSTTPFASNEDVAIFEQLRHQLIVWLRIEAVRTGADISGQGPAQLLDLLHQQHTFDETRLQIVSTLLNLSNQVIANNFANLMDYKQAMLFYLMHTRR